MSRSIVRFIAGAALVAAVPAISQAQSCTVNDAYTMPAQVWSCGSPIAVTANFAVPYLAYISVGSTALVFPAPAGDDWDAFLAAPAAEEVITGTLLTIRTNASHDVVLSSSGWSGGAWVNGDVTYGIKTGSACSAPADANSTLGASQDLYTNASATNGVANRYLCLGLNVPGDLSSAKLAPGDYDLSLTLTITSP